MRLIRPKSNDLYSYGAKPAGPNTDLGHILGPKSNDVIHMGLVLTWVVFWAEKR